MSDLRITICTAGYCTCPEHLAMNGGRWRLIHFPAMFALFEHPRLGAMLFDTGYSQRFFEETQAFPARIYRWLTPVTLRPEQLAATQLARRGLRASDVTHVFISHFHADHVAALADFPQARYVYLPQAYTSVQGLKGLRALQSAHLPGLLPPDFEARAAPIRLDSARPLPPEYAPFSTGFDLLGDESLLAVKLPGHAAGHMGLLARAANGETYFFVADAAWLAGSIIENRPPHRLANLLFSDPPVYRQTLAGLHDIQTAAPGLHIIPSHCAETLARYCDTAETGHA